MVVELGSDIALVLIPYLKVMGGIVQTVKIGVQRVERQLIMSIPAIPILVDCLEIYCGLNGQVVQKGRVLWIRHIVVYIRNNVSMEAIYLTLFYFTFYHYFSCGKGVVKRHTMCGIVRKRAKPVLMSSTTSSSITSSKIIMVFILGTRL